MAGGVLITQGTRPFAQRVAKFLQAQHMVLFGSAEEFPEVLLRSGNYLRIPAVTAPVFVHEILKVCLDNGIETLIPLGEHELYPMAKARQLFSEYGISVWIPEETELQSLAVIKNPPKQLPLLLLCDGRALSEPHGNELHGTLSGVFTARAPGGGLALCCIAD